MIFWGLTCPEIDKHQHPTNSNYHYSIAVRIRERRPSEFTRTASSCDLCERGESLMARRWTRCRLRFACSVIGTAAERGRDCGSFARSVRWCGLRGGGALAGWLGCGVAKLLD